MTTLALGPKLRGTGAGLLIGLLALALNVAVFCTVFWLIDGDIERPAPVKIRPVTYLVPQPVKPIQAQARPETAEPRLRPKLEAVAKPLPRPTPRPLISSPPLDLSVKTGLLPGPKLGLPPRPLAAADPAAALPPRTDAARTAPGAKVASLPGPAKITSPGLINRVPPIYPYAARRRGLEGWVAIRLMVDQSGRVEKVEILQAEPEKVFEAAVIRAARQWRFRPARQQGRPVAAAYRTVVRFELKGAGKP